MKTFEEIKKEAKVYLPGWKILFRQISDENLCGGFTVHDRKRILVHTDTDYCAAHTLVHEMAHALRRDGYHNADWERQFIKLLEDFGFTDKKKVLEREELYGYELERWAKAA